MFIRGHLKKYNYTYHRDHSSSNIKFVKFSIKLGTSSDGGSSGRRGSSSRRATSRRHPPDLTDSGVSVVSDSGPSLTPSASSSDR